MLDLERVSIGKADFLKDGINALDDKMKFDSGLSQIGQKFSQALEEAESLEFNEDDATRFELEDVDTQGSPESSTLMLDEMRAAIKSCRDQEELCAQDSLDMLNGKEVNVHNMMINLKKAELQTQFVVNVTNKLVNGINEILRINA
ncbi:MAG: flagellar hook-basal body complex protein FliE [Oscillospiraceae bacterium]|nr:flagellar hook-basal body complex protein FliE [Oscillospiraceae bacterium]